MYERRREGGRGRESDRDSEKEGRGGDGRERVNLKECRNVVNERTHPATPPKRCSRKLLSQQPVFYSTTVHGWTNQKLPEEAIEMREGEKNPTNQKKVTISQYSTRPIKKDSTRETSSRRIPPKPSSRRRGNNSFRDLPLLLSLCRASTAKRRRRVGRTDPRIIIATSRNRNSHTLLIRIVLPSAANAHTSRRTRERRSR